MVVWISFLISGLLLAGAAPAEELTCPQICGADFDAQGTSRLGRWGSRSTSAGSYSDGETTLLCCSCQTALGRIIDKKRIVLGYTSPSRGLVIVGEPSPTQIERCLGRPNDAPSAPNDGSGGGPSTAGTAN